MIILIIIFILIILIIISSLSSSSQPLRHHRIDYAGRKGRDPKSDTRTVSGFSHRNNLYRVGLRHRDNLFWFYIDTETRKLSRCNRPEPDVGARRGQLHSTQLDEKSLVLNFPVPRRSGDFSRGLQRAILVKIDGFPAVTFLS